MRMIFKGKNHGTTCIWLAHGTDCPIAQRFLSHGFKRVQFSVLESNKGSDEPIIENIQVEPRAMFLLALRTMKAKQDGAELGEEDRQVENNTESDSIPNNSL